jgi:hypothetical protein
VTRCERKDGCATRDYGINTRIGQVGHAGLCETVQPLLVDCARCRTWSTVVAVTAAMEDSGTARSSEESVP